MVCLGNICRSPTAHGIFQKMIEDNGLIDKIEVHSAGTGSWHIGENPDPRSIEAAAVRGYRIDSLVARQVEASDFQRFHYILAMDHSNLKDLRALCPAAYRPKLKLLLDYAESGYDAVPDPYYSGARGFELVLDLVEQACQRLLAVIRTQHALDSRS